MVLRQNTSTGQLELLLGNRENSSDLHLPKGFVLPGEDSTAALGRVLEQETGWRPTKLTGDLLHEGYTYDSRQTDHAWVALEARHLHVEYAAAPALFRPGEQFDEMAWAPLDEETLADLKPSHAQLVQAAQARLQQAVVAAPTGQS